MTSKMKKRVIICVILCIALLLSSCGNLNIGLGKFTFRRVHIIPTGQCLELESWRECDVGIEVKTKEYGALWLSEGTYILCEDHCPICEED